LPIKRELRWFYPIDWPEISRRARFEHAGGVWSHATPGAMVEAG
jgi:hypothetical protein